jgi:hypothetical protein
MPEPQQGDQQQGDQQQQQEQVSQERLQAIAANEKKQGREAALREIEQQLGMSPADAAKFLKEAKAERDKNLSDAQKAAEQAAADKAEAEKIRQQGRDESLTGRIALALASAGCHQAIEDAVALVRRRDITADSDKKDIEAAVKDLKTAMPTLFGEVHGTEGKKQVGNDAKPPHGAKQHTGRFGQNGWDRAVKEGLVKQDQAS